MTPTTPRPMLGLLAAALALWGAWGCGPSRPAVDTSREEVTVSGTVYRRGQPAKSGVIVFDPSNIKRRDVFPSQAEIREDGTYTVTTLVGRNLVSVTELDGQEGDFLYPHESFEAQVGQENTFDVRIGSDSATSPREAEAEERAGFES